MIADYSVSNSMNLKRPLSINELNNHTNSTKSPSLNGSMNQYLTFHDKYELDEMIGRGGFSTVYRCHRKDSNHEDVYAVKIIDLRPLRLKEKFNPQRLLREVNIMKRLFHTNIIQFMEVFESKDELLMVMEYFPGEELFDLILSKQSLNEEEAKKIFSQIIRAVFYLHSIHILHRDIKPENILISKDQGDSLTGYQLVKLVDFGLSKDAGIHGSEGKTFVGTPCYLAPEVELTAKGQGHYGLPADCWSLGAVLYVMLVARFPEFEKDSFGRVIVKLSSPMWDKISPEAKDLIRGLMNTNSVARLTAAKAAQHPWLGQYRMTQKELSEVSLSCYDLGHELQELRQADEGNNSYDLVTNQSSDPQLHSLLHLHKTIANNFDQATVEIPEMTALLREAGLIRRTQISETKNLLRSVENISSNVLSTFSDLELAVEVGEPKLANDIFNLMRTWVIELKQKIESARTRNHESIVKVQSIFEKSTNTVMEAKNQAIRTHMQTTALVLLQQVFGNTSSTVPGTPSTRLLTSGVPAGVPANAEHIIDLFMNLFQFQSSVGMSPFHHPPASHSIDTLSSEGTMNDPRVRAASDLETANSIESYHSQSHDNCMVIDSPPPAPQSETPQSYRQLNDIDEGPAPTQIIDSFESSKKSSFTPTPVKALNQVHGSPELNLADLQLQIPPSPPSPKAEVGDGSNTPTNGAFSYHLRQAYDALQSVDQILHKMQLLWEHTELVLDTITRKGQHIEVFIGYCSSNPRLLARFKERLEEYKRFWENIALDCVNYINGIEQEEVAEVNDSSSVQSTTSSNRFKLTSV